MSHPSTLFRFRLELSDIDRGVYETLDLRVAMHPSETPAFLLTRVLAYALNFQEGLEFSPGGLSDTDEPCLRAVELNGRTRLWIEIGNPSARKLHKASKASPLVKVYTYKDPMALLREIAGAQIHRVQELEIYSLQPEFLKRMEKRLERDNRWGVMHNEGALTIAIGAEVESGEVIRHGLTN